MRASFSALVSLARSEVDRVRIYRCELRNTTSGTDVELTGKLRPWVILEPASDGSREMATPTTRYPMNFTLLWLF